jgi:hypothetical protein
MKNYYSGMIAVMIAMICFGFTNPNEKAKMNVDTIVLTFRGSIFSEAQIEDGTFWVEEPDFYDPEYEGCVGNGAACAIQVNIDSTLGWPGPRYLDTSKIWLVATYTGGTPSRGYVVNTHINSPDLIWNQWHLAN